MIRNKKLLERQSFIDVKVGQMFTNLQMFFVKNIYSSWCYQNLRESGKISVDEGQSPKINTEWAWPSGPQVALL